MANKIKRILIYGIIILLLSFSCKENKQQIEIEKILTEWIGKEIQFPKDCQCNVLGKDTTSDLCTNLFDREYKILLYIDSLGCTKCKLRLFELKRLIAEADSLDSGKLSFLFFFHPKDIKELQFMFKLDKMIYPVFIDTDNVIGQLNRFPEEESYQCFLLDKDNRIVMIGNPTINPKIWELYKKQVFGDRQGKELPVTSVKPDKMNHDYGSIRKGSKNKAEFLLENTGNQVLVISRVKASCGCTNVDWEKQPVEPGKTGKISVEMTPDETGHFNKTIEVYGNVEQPVKLTMTGNVTE
jgi:hypothetical protein